MSAINPLFRVVSPIRSIVLPPAHTSTPEAKRYIPATINNALMIVLDSSERIVNSFPIPQAGYDRRCFYLCLMFLKYALVVSVRLLS